MNNYILLILGMAFVTYIPRLIPFVFIGRQDLPSNFKKFLELIPYTALGALIIPGVFSATPEMPAAGLVGIGFALIYGWYKGGIIVSVLGSIFVTFIFLIANNGFIL